MRSTGSFELEFDAEILRQKISAVYCVSLTQVLSTVGISHSHCRKDSGPEQLIGGYRVTHRDFFLLAYQYTNGWIVDEYSNEGGILSQWSDRSDTDSPLLNVFVAEVQGHRFNPALFWKKFVRMIRMPGSESLLLVFDTNLGMSCHCIKSPNTSLEEHVIFIEGEQGCCFALNDALADDLLLEKRDKLPYWVLDQYGRCLTRLRRGIQK